MVPAVSCFCAVVFGVLSRLVALGVDGPLDVRGVVGAVWCPGEVLGAAACADLGPFGAGLVILFGSALCRAGLGAVVPPLVVLVVSVESSCAGLDASPRVLGVLGLGVVLLVPCEVAVSVGRLAVGVGPLLVVPGEHRSFIPADSPPCLLLAPGLLGVRCPPFGVAVFLVLGVGGLFIVPW